MYSSAFCSVGLQAYNLKSPNISLDKVYEVYKDKVIILKRQFQFVE
jgi:hypothetical protein